MSIKEHVHTKDHSLKTAVSLDLLSTLFQDPDTEYNYTYI